MKLRPDRMRGPGVWMHHEPPKPPIVDGHSRGPSTARLAAATLALRADLAVCGTNPAWKMQQATPGTSTRPVGSLLRQSGPKRANVAASYAYQHHLPPRKLTALAPHPHPHPHRTRTCGAVQQDQCQWRPQLCSNATARSASAPAVYNGLLPKLASNHAFCHPGPRTAMAPCARRRHLVRRVTTRWEAWRVIVAKDPPRSTGSFERTSGRADARAVSATYLPVRQPSAARPSFHSKLEINGKIARSTSAHQPTSLMVGCAVNRRDRRFEEELRASRLKVPLQQRLSGARRRLAAASRRQLAARLLTGRTSFPRRSGCFCGSRTL